MKKILITGANSYIGTSFEKYIKQFPDYSVDTLDMLDSSWWDYDFSKYNVIFHVAGIAHIKETKENAELYYKVNCDLAEDVAKKAQVQGVEQFIYLSSMSVYGIDCGVITKETVPVPKSNYGKSKFQAEQKLFKLQSDNFKVTILRPPMVYGKECKGNFQAMIKIIEKFPVFPKLENRRSMIYIDNLSSFVKLAVDKKISGVFCPQNKEYIQTSYMAKLVSEETGKKVVFSKILGIIAKLMTYVVTPAKKAFGNLIYKGVDDFEFCYCIVENERSIRKSVCVEVAANKIRGELK